MNGFENEIIHRKEKIEPNGFRKKSKKRGSNYTKKKKR